MTTNIDDLFGAAQGSGILSQAAVASLGAVDFGANIQNALGVSPDALESTEAFLVSILVDDSSSIRDYGNEDNIRNGHNAVLDALAGSKSDGDILVMTASLNRGIISPYSPLAKAVRLDHSNFQASGCTPLYDRSLEILKAIIVKEQELAANGIPVRSATLIGTDGADYGSRMKARDVKPVIEDLLRAENHIIAGLGIADSFTDFEAVFRSMGIRSGWILTPGNSPTEIRKAFQVFSKSAVSASQNAASFSKTAAGGFGATP